MFCFWKKKELFPLDLNVFRGEAEGLGEIKLTFSIGASYYVLNVPSNAHGLGFCIIEQYRLWLGSCHGMTKKWPGLAASVLQKLSVAWTRQKGEETSSSIKISRWIQRTVYGITFSCVRYWGRVYEITNLLYLAMTLAHFSLDRRLPLCQIRTRPADW